LVETASIFISLANCFDLCDKIWMGLILPGGRLYKKYIEN